jgi:uncharacterized protein (DUF2126 family)
MSATRHRRVAALDPRAVAADTVNFVRFGSWPCKNSLAREVGERPGPVRSQATIAAIRGSVPTMFMAPVRLSEPMVNLMANSGQNPKCSFRAHIVRCVPESAQVGHRW